MSSCFLVISDDSMQPTPEAKSQREVNDSDVEELQETGTPMEEDVASPAGTVVEDTPNAAGAPSAAQAPSAALAS